MKSPDIVGRASGVQVSGGLTNLDLRQLPGLFLWYKAEDIALPIGDPIPSISDAGPFGTNALQDTSTLQATVIAVPVKANRKAISMNNPENVYWIGVTPTNATNKYTVHLAYYHTIVGLQYLWFPGGTLVAAPNGSGGGIGYFDGVWKVSNTQPTGYAVLSWQLDVNGGAVNRQGVPVYNTTYTAQAVANSGALFGNRANGGLGPPVRGHIFEVAVFSPALTDAQRALVDQYLMNKYEIG